MTARRRALLAVVAVVLALLSPTATHQAGTAGARVTAAAPDAVPTARLSLRQQHEQAPVVDATPVVTAPPWAPDSGRAGRTGTDQPGSRAATPPRSRGPPQV
jgi:hypothetical protein